MGTQTVLVSHRRIIMKGLIILAVVAAASAAPSCDDCKAAVAGFKDHLLSEESLGEQQAILTLAACPQAPDPAQCEQWVATYWAGIAESVQEGLHLRRVQGRPGLPGWRDGRRQLHLRGRGVLAGSCLLRKRWRPHT